MTSSWSPDGPATTTLLAVTSAGLVLLERELPAGLLGPARFPAARGVDSGLAAQVRARYGAELVGLRTLTLPPGRSGLLHAGLLVGHAPRYWAGLDALPLEQLLDCPRVEPSLRADLAALAVRCDLAEVLLGWRTART